MANWWDAAPLAQAQAAPSAAPAGNWWDAAPVVKQANPATTPKPQPKPSVAFDVAQQTAQGIVKGIPNLLDMGGAAVATLADKAMGGKKGFGDTFTQYAAMRPVSNAVDAALGTQEREATSTLGRYANVGGQALGSLGLGGVKAAASVPMMGRAFVSGGAGAAASDVGAPVGEVIGGVIAGEEGAQVGKAVGGLGAGLAGAVYADRKLTNLGNQFKQGFNSKAGVFERTKTADQIREQASKLYQKADAAGGVLAPKVTDEFIDTALRTMKPQTAAGKVVAGESTSSKLADRLQGLRGKPLTLAEAQEIDEYLGDTIDGLTEFGKLTKEGRRVFDLQTSLRDAIEGAAPETGGVIGSKEGFEALKEGRKLWGQQARLRDVEKIITRAEMADNPATALKTGFRNLVNNPQRLRGFSKVEREAIIKAANSGVIGDTLRTFGSRLMPIVGGASGGFGGAVAGQAISMASRGAATRAQVAKAADVANIIANNGQRVTAMTRAGRAMRDLMGVDNTLPPSPFGPATPPVAPAAGGITRRPSVVTPAAQAAPAAVQAGALNADDAMREYFKGSRLVGQSDLDKMATPVNLNKLASQIVKATAPIHGTQPKELTLTQFLSREFGGVNDKALQGDVGKGKFIFKNSAGADDAIAAEAAYKAGYITQPDTNLLREALQRKNVYPANSKAVLDAAFNKQAQDQADLMLAELGIDVSGNAAQRMAQAKKIVEDAIAEDMMGNSAKLDVLRGTFEKYAPKGNQSGSMPASGLVKAIGGAAAGLGLADFASSVATNTSYNPKEPIRDRNAERAMQMAQDLDAAENQVVEQRQAPSRDELGDLIKQLEAQPTQTVSATHTIKEEGFEPRVYKDSRGFKTVGIGFNMEQGGAREFWKKAGVPENFDRVLAGKQELSRESAEALFGFKKERAAKIAATLVPNYEKLGDNQRAALEGMVYQLGANGTRAFKNTLTALTRGNPEAVVYGVMRSAWAKQTPARAKRAALMLAYDLPPAQAEQILLQNGQISQNELKYVN